MTLEESIIATNARMLELLEQQTTHLAVLAAACIYHVERDEQRRASGKYGSTSSRDPLTEFLERIGG